MDKYYSELMASYLAKRKCDDSFIRYLFSKGASRKTPEDLERADERKRRLQRERSRRYRALKNARRRTDDGPADTRRDPYKFTSDEGSRARRGGTYASADYVFYDDDSSSGNDEPPTLCKFVEEDLDTKLKQSRLSSCSDSVSDENSTHSFSETKDTHLAKNLSVSLKEFLNAPSQELDYSTVHSLMFHWLQT